MHLDSVNSSSWQCVACLACHVSFMSVSFQLHVSASWQLHVLASWQLDSELTSATVDGSRHKRGTLRRGKTVDRAQHNLLSDRQWCGRNVLMGKRQPIRMISDTPPTGMCGWGTLLKPCSCCDGHSRCRHGFALMPETCQSPSELGNLSGLRNTDGCTNYRTDPVRV
jgi:hypothetical protein